MINIRDSNGRLLACLEDYTEPTVSEVINGAYTISLVAIIDEDGKSQYIHHENRVEADGQMYSIVEHVRKRTASGELLVAVYGEHVSYKLLDGELESYTAYGTPAALMAALFEGTPFTIGTVQFPEPITVAMNENTNKRAVLFEIARLCGGELAYDNYSVSLLTRRGQDRGVHFLFGKNVFGISKKVSMSSGTVVTSYEIDILELNRLPEYEGLEYFELGDTVRIVDDDLGINESQRIIKYEYDPRQRMSSKIVISNAAPGIEDTIANMAKTTVVKDSTYNGVKIGPEHGFEAIRSDGKARTVMNATEGIKIQSGNGFGSWKDKFYADLFGNLILAGIIYAEGGVIGGWTIEEGKLSGNGEISGGKVTGSTISGGTIVGALVTAATIIGSLIKTASTGQRVELSSDENLLQAINEAGAKLKIVPNIGGVPALVFEEGSSRVKLFKLSNVFSINTTEADADITLASARAIRFQPGGGHGVLLPSWSMLTSQSTGKTLQQELSSFTVEINDLLTRVENLEAIVYSPPPGV